MATSMVSILSALQNAVVAINSLAQQVTNISLSAGPIGATGSSGATGATGSSGSPGGGTQLTGIATYSSNHIALASEAGYTIQMNSSVATTVTVAPNSSINLPILSYVNITQSGSAATTITAGSGVTINNRNGLKTAGQYAMATIYHSTTLDTWLAGGDLTT